MSEPNNSPVIDNAWILAAISLSIKEASDQQRPIAGLIFATLENREGDA